MAVRNWTVEPIAAGARRVIWEGLADDDTGKPIQLPKYPDKTVQFYGDFGSGTATIQGSNDPRANPDDADHANAVWFNIEDVGGTVISKTSNAAETFQQAPQWIRPVLTGATGGDLVVSLVARKN